VAAGLVAGLAFALVLAAVLLIRPGVSEVIPGQILRSPQPTAAELRQLIRRYDIRTVVSLRGTGAQHRWLRDERALCKELGVRHMALSFDPDEWPARYQSAYLVKLLDNAARPILLHCRQGIDRAGFASVTARLLAGHAMNEALTELSFRRGHLCKQSLCPIHLFFDLYLDHLLGNNLDHSSSAFRHWVISMYCPPRYDVELELLGAAPTFVSVNSPVRFRVRAHNRGREDWRFTAGKFGVRLGARFIGPFEGIPEHPLALFRSSDHPTRDLARAGLHEDVFAPGQTRVFEIEFRSPRQPGTYVIQLDMVDELVHWFSDIGWPGILLPLEVTASP